LSTGLFVCKRVQVLAMKRDGRQWITTLEEMRLLAVQAG